RRHRRFNPDVALGVEIITCRFRYPMTHSQITRKTRPSKIEIPVCRPQILILRFGIERERQCVSAIQNPQLSWNDFDVTSCKVWIFSARQARGDSTRNFNHIFAPQTVRFLREFRVFLRPKNNLSQTFAIAEIDENDAAMIARDVYPAG